MSKEFIVTAAMSPMIIPVNELEKANSLVFTPNGGGTYSVHFTCTPMKSKNTINWVLDPNITSVSTQKTAEYGKITRIKVTLVSGTSVTAELI